MMGSAMNSSEIRQRFLDFFAGHGHAVVRSSSLVPHNDPTLYFTNAGMVQFKDIFTGAERPSSARAASVQKCLRVSGKHNDLEVVGRTPRHHTFFEMLGNFSFGDYFKRDAIAMAWELLTGVYGMDPDRLWVSVFEEDDEAYDLWRQAGFPEARLQRLDAKENFWSMGPVGPCGPCSELHYDLGPGMGSDTRGPAGGSDRYMEIWNLVFMQFEQHEDGSRTSLPSPSIDTGAGLERVTAVLQGKQTNWDTDLFVPLIGQVAQRAGVRYGGGGSEQDVAMRVIADHARATAFLIADGVMPANDGRGYVLRRIMRRAIRYGVKLGFEDPFLFATAAEVIERFGEPYPGLRERAQFIHEVVLGEEERFSRTLERGTRLLTRALEGLKAGGSLDGEVVFELKDTYGFPVDLTRLMASEGGFTIDEARFEALEAEQKARGRANWKGSGQEAVAGLWYEIADGQGQTRFTGYDRVEDVSTVVALVRVDGEEIEQVEALKAGQRGIVVVDRTPFYAESGGQVGDTGALRKADAAFEVADTTKASGLFLHHGAVEAGAIGVGDTLQACADGARRDHTRRNHTATHLAHAALREVLGDHVQQKGSLVGPGRLRFDFAHHRPMTAEEIARVEDIVNGEILKDAPVNTDLKELEAARASGAMALFGEKYDDVVRVVTVPGFSIELCGGTHVGATGQIGAFTITSEGGVAAGVRRIEAQTGVGALAHARQIAGQLESIAGLLKTSAAGVVEAVARLQDERKALLAELDAVRREAATAAAGDMLSGVREIGGIKVIAAEFEGDLREQSDRLRDKLGSSLVVLVSRRGPKVQIVVAASKDVAGVRINAGEVLRELAPIVGGRGGGRPDLAQGGGTDADAVPAMLERAWSLVAELLS